MRIAVVYESIYGNTGAVAAAIAEGLAEHGDVTSLRPDEPPVQADLVVFGAPTHAHGLPSKMSRADIEKEVAERKERGEKIDYYPTAGVRMLIEDLPYADDTPAACFDTRFEKSKVLTGSAAKTMTKKLRRRGYRMVAPPESFFVEGTEGPLKEGELDRARAWGTSIGALATVPG